MRKQISHFSLIILFWFVNLLLAVTSVYLVAWIYGVIMIFYNSADMKPLLAIGTTLVSSFTLIATVSAIIALYVFRKFIRNIKYGKTFTDENSRLLKSFWIGLIVVCTLTFLQKLAFYHFFVSLGEAGPTWSFNIWLLILALLVGIFLHIFSIGKNLQTENDLTI